MTFTEMEAQNKKTLMLLPGTCCDWETNFGTVIEPLKERYHLICVNYDGFDGTDSVFPDVITVTEKIEAYIKEHFGGHLDGALGSSLGGSFVGQLIQRRNVHIDHGIFGSSDLDQSGIFAAKIQTALVGPLLTSFAKNQKKREKTKSRLKEVAGMDEETSEKLLDCFSKFSIESIKNEYYTDLITRLNEGIDVEGTQVHFIYAKKMGNKYLNRYKKYFRNPDIKEFDMQHEQWLFGSKEYAEPVLAAIYGWLGE